LEKLVSISERKKQKITHSNDNRNKMIESNPILSISSSSTPKIDVSLEKSKSCAIESDLSTSAYNIYDTYPPYHTNNSYLDQPYNHQYASSYYPQYNQHHHSYIGPDVASSSSSSQPPYYNQTAYNNTNYNYSYENSYAYMPMYASVAPPMVQSNNTFYSYGPSRSSGVCDSTSATAAYIHEQTATANTLIRHQQNSTSPNNDDDDNSSNSPKSIDSMCSNNSSTSTSMLSPLGVVKQQQHVAFALPTKSNKPVKTGKGKRVCNRQTVLTGATMSLEVDAEVLKVNRSEMANIGIKLTNASLWDRFNCHTTEMIITKQGRYVIVIIL
jgi:hypothetical protein